MKKSTKVLLATIGVFVVSLVATMVIAKYSLGDFKTFQQNEMKK
jgi:hypothetical protein